MDGYIIGVEPANPQKGKETVFYIRRNGATPYTEEFQQEESHVIPTMEMPWQQLYSRLEQLANNPQLQGIEFKKLPYSAKRGKSRKGVIHAVCSKEQHQLLPAYFLKYSQNSPSAMLRWRFPTFANVKIENGKVNHDWRYGFAPLEDIVNDRKVAIDIEWDQKGEIYMAIFYTGDRFGDYLLTTVPIGRDRVGDAQVLQLANQEALVKELSDFVIRYDPLWIIGHYIGGDKRRLRDEPEEELYLPGIGERRDVVRSVQRTSKKDEKGAFVTQVKKMVTKGRLTFDTLPYLVHYQNIIRDNRLPAHAQNIGLDFKKSLNHIEMWLLVAKARNNDRDAALELAEYQLNDGIAELALGKYYLETLVRKSIMFRRDPDSMCATQRLANGYERWKRRYFLTMHTFKDRYQNTDMAWAKKRGGDFDFVPELKHDKYSLLELPRDKTGRFLVQGGFFNGVSTVYITPYIFALEPLINQFPEAEDFLERMKKEKEPSLKFDIVKTLNAYINQPMAELEEALARAGFKLGDLINSPNDIPQELDKRDWAFGQEYKLDKFGYSEGGRSTNLLNLNNSLFLWKTRANHLLEGAEVINYSPNFLFLRNVDADELEQQGIGINMGSGPVISNRNFVIANASGKYTYSGIGVSRNIRFDFGRDLIYDLIENALDSKPEEELYGMLKTGIDELEQGRAPRTRLVYKSKGAEYGMVMNGAESLELGYAEFIWRDDLPADYRFYRESFLKLMELFKLVMPNRYRDIEDLLHGKRNLFS